MNKKKNQTNQHFIVLSKWVWTSWNKYMYLDAFVIIL